MKACGREKEYKGAVVGLLGGITALEDETDREFRNVGIH